MPPLKYESLHLNMKDIRPDLIPPAVQQRCARATGVAKVHQNRPETLAESCSIRYELLFVQNYLCSLLHAPHFPSHVPGLSPVTLSEEMRTAEFDHVITCRQGSKFL